MAKVDPHYRDMLRDHPQPYCWLCGRGLQSKPEWWHAPWLIERAHIVNKPRVADRRVVVLLCSLDHKISHGESFARAKNRPPVLKNHLIWLKRKFDWDFFDPEFMQRHSVQKLPVELPPSPFYLSEHRQRRPESAKMPMV